MTCLAHSLKAPQHVVRRTDTVELMSPPEDDRRHRVQNLLAGRPRRERQRHRV